MSFRSGYIGLVGPTNAGKSTLLNRLIGSELAIVSHKPQTTRHRIQGIYTDHEAQLIFCDTPGLHESAQPLNQAMLQVVRDTLKDMNALCLVLDVTVPNKTWREFVQGLDTPVLIVLNKSDLLNPRKKQMDSGDILVSALTGAGCDVLRERLKTLVPPGPAYYPEEMYTEHSMRFIAAEVIREKCLLSLEQEVPYGVSVIIESFKEEKILKIHASIIINREAHKRIIIGKGGAMLKAIGQAARLDLEKRFGQRIFLKLFVRVEKDWIKNQEKIKEFVYGQT